MFGEDREDKMMFKKGTQLYSYEIKRESGENVMYINYLGSPVVPDLADSPEVMARTVDILIENQNISRIVFVQQRNYNYDFKEVSHLLEIANLYNHLVKQESILSPDRLVLGCKQCLGKRHDNITYFITLLKQDPIAAYYEVKRFLKEERGLLERVNESCKDCQTNYARLLERIVGLMEETSLIREGKTREYEIGSREIYQEFFRPDVIPNFTFTRLVSQLPEDAEIVDEYEIGEGYDKSNVTILKKKNKSKYIYHLTPPEYTLDENFHMLLNLARNVLIEHRPKQEEFTDIERTRQTFFNISRDLLQDLAKNKNINLSYKDSNKLAIILVRYTIGFGLVEVLLKDRNLQDIVLNAPVAKNPIFVRHQKFDECITNVLPSQEDAESWAAKFRMLSGRPLDESNPVLDTQLRLGKVRSRVAAIQQPLSPNGLSYAIRRHRENPWTLPLFIKNKMINSFTAGLLSFFIDGSRTMLIAGTRSSGKTSLAGSLMLEIMPKYRIICLEDTLELPVESLRKLSYDILRMKVRSALLKETSEVAADEGIRTSLRFGDSCLVVGEVRSKEARALYEAMRVGALANVVMGTIHGASPYAVFDRVVNDLNVPATSFKATDLILVANPVKSSSGLQSWRRVVQLAEVRKHWSKDPEDENGFVDLLKYDVDKDELIPSEDLINGNSEIIKEVASNVKGWAGDWDAVYDNILLRGRVKKELVKLSGKMNFPELLEAEFNTKSNQAFYEISDKIKREVGLPESGRVFPEWQKWLNKEARKFKKRKGI
jgi:type IV secretory pathway ATPase VirB11/archaellum biosynthesis ATPase